MNVNHRDIQYLRDTPEKKEIIPPEIECAMSDGESCRECEVVFQDDAVMVLFKPAG